MRSFANLFLVLFLADGGLSLLDELVSLLAPLPPLSELRQLLANVVILLAVPLYLSLGIDRRLPKRLFLPQTLFVFWCPLFALALPALAAGRTCGILTAAAQVALGLLPLFLFGRPGSRSLTIPPERFAAPRFRLGNTLVFAAANLAALPLVLALVVFSAANAYLAEHTAGFMRLSPGGLTMIERVYRRGDRTVRLAGMIHMGEREYYEDLERSIAPGRTIVLAEGVTDDGGLLRSGLDYGRVAGLLGLTPQAEMPFPGEPIGPEALDGPRGSSPDAEKGRAAPADILAADVDVSAFRPPTIRLLDALGKSLQESPSLVKGLQATNDWAEKHLTPAMHDIVMDDILHRRNLVVIGYLGKALERYDTVVIPWGALHMKEIEADVLRRGFALAEERERISIGFRKLAAGAP